MTAEELEAGKDFGRYKDVDGDGIPWRTYPGTHPTKGAFSRAAPRATRMPATPSAGRTTSTTWSGCCAKFRTAADLVPQPVLRSADQADTPWACSTSAPPARPCRKRWTVLTAANIHIDALRLRAFPFPDSVDRFIAAHEQVFVVEQNRDAQMHALLVNELGVDPARLVKRAALRRHADHGALHCPGHRIPSARRRRAARRPHDLPRQAPVAPPHTARTTRWATPGATTKAASPPCARAAGTTPSRRPSSRPAGSWTSNPTASPSSRALAAAPKRRTIFWAPRTASTPCTAACPRC
jgi:hypothetical protein